MSDIFDLEQNIMKCWSITDDLDLVIRKIEKCNDDDTMNALIGLKSLYQEKFDILWENFEEVCTQYHTARRAAEVKND